MNINSPEENFSRKLFLAFLISFFALILIIISFLIIYRMAAGPAVFLRIPSISSPSFTVTKSDLPKCESCDDLKNKLQAFYKESKEKGHYNRFGWGDIGIESLALPESAQKATGESSAPSGAGTDYSETNIQVAGVDEADIVKTDGKYIYTVSKNILTISEAYPLDAAKLLSKIELSSGSMPREIFIDKDNLLVFGTRNYYKEISPPSIQKGEITGEKFIGKEIYPYPYPSNLTFVEIYNVSNRKNPALKRKLEFDGSYLSSRKIDNYVYFILNNYPDYRILENDKISDNEIKNIIPAFRDFKEKEIDKEKDFEPIVDCSKISYIEPITSAQYVSVVGVPIDDYEKEPAKEVILGSSQNIYASLENLYIVNAQYQYSRGIFNAILENTAESREKTEIYKFSLDKGKIQYLTKGEVPGTVLNQFSMDEYDSYFRIATTKRSFGMRRSQPTNNIYILDKDLKITGSVEDIAPGETIYSARFMGKKGYLVTFKKIDPFFTFDLSDPKNPKIIGKLKIPGYSDYLHPYDENHILGIGKNTIEAEEIWGDDFEWHQGIKMAIFDVTDFENPREMHKIVIGDRGSDSPILRDHKAFLFDKDKNLLVIPILLAEIPEDMKKDPKRARNMYGEYTFQGSFVYDISLEKGFVLKGRVTHFDDDEIFKKSGYYFAGDDFNVKRNLYIENYLYSISDGKILINSLDDLAEKGKIELPKVINEPSEYPIYPPFPDFPVSR